MQMKVLNTSIHAGNLRDVGFKSARNPAQLFCSNRLYRRIFKKAEFFVREKQCTRFGNNGQSGAFNCTPYWPECWGMEELNQQRTIAEIEGMRWFYGFDGDLSFRRKHYERFGCEDGVCGKRIAVLIVDNSDRRGRLGCFLLG